MKQQGRISDREYENQQRWLQTSSKRTSTWSGWWRRAPVGLFGPWLVLSLIWPSGSSGFPTCGARMSREVLRQAIEENEDSKIKNTRLLALDEVRELSHEPKTPELYCGGLASLNSGEQRIAWKLYQRGSNLFVEVFGL